MIAELKRVVQPFLRSAGFSGSFPHYRRIGGVFIDLLTFQFDRHGGGFVIEIARCSGEGIITYWGKYIPPNEVTAWNVNPPFRKRLKAAQQASGTDGWFRYDVRPISEVAITAKMALERYDIWSDVVPSTTGRPAGSNV